VGVTSAGVGVVAVATGLYFGHRASALGDEVTTACRSGCDWATYRAKDADGRSAETKQYVFLGIGAAAIIGGGVLYWLGMSDPQEASVTVAPSGDGAAITWSTRW
jgi:hypothetical protein